MSSPLYLAIAAQSLSPLPEIVMTMNLREWRHFIRLRGSRAAHPQIVEITAMIREEFIKRYPVFFEDLA
jgi:thymidylate synthase (FAD)